jgi:hypothetical protein
MLLPVGVSYVQAHTIEPQHGLAMFAVGFDRAEMQETCM